VSLRQPLLALLAVDPNCGQAPPCRLWGLPMMVRIALATFFMFFSINAAAQVNAIPAARHILVYGDAQARAIPDRFKITVNFEAVDLDADAARRRVESSLRDVLQQLDRQGVDPTDIVATSLRIDAKERYDEKKDEEIFLGTQVSRSLTARFQDKGALERFIGTIKTSRELTVSNVQTELSSEPELRRALREKAIESSREKAETIAKAYGARLGGLYSVSDVAPQFQYGIREGSWPSAYEWRTRNLDGGGQLDRITVTGSRVQGFSNESFQTGYVTFDDKIYAVFLLAD